MTMSTLGIKKVNRDPRTCLWGRHFFAVLVVLLLADGLFAAEEEQIDQHIANLSHHSFAMRTRAEQSLLRIGLPAQPGLIDALDHDDA